MAKLDAKDGPYAAIILAAVGLERIGFGSRITSLIGPPVLYPAVGQAALGVEIRSNDPRVSQITSVLTHRETQLTCVAERACLRLLEGGCSVPVGISSDLKGDVNAAGDSDAAVLTMIGTVTSLDGKVHVKVTSEGSVKSVEDAETRGRELAEKLIAEGADVILTEIKNDRQAKQQASETPQKANTSEAQ